MMISRIKLQDSDDEPGVGVLRREPHIGHEWSDALRFAVGWTIKKSQPFAYSSWWCLVWSAKTELFQFDFSCACFTKVMAFFSVRHIDLGNGTDLS